MPTAADHLRALADVVSVTGVFENVFIGESKSAPSNEGAHCDVFITEPPTPVQSSGLAALSVRMEVHMRIYVDVMFSQPQETPELLALRAQDTLCRALAAGYTLGGTVRMIDLLGADGEGLRSEVGYVSIDKRIFRVMEVFAPIVINDHWPMAE